MDHNLVCSVHPVHHFKTTSSWEELLWMHKELCIAQCAPVVVMVVVVVKKEKVAYE